MENRNRGFTLIEVIIVLAVFAILAAALFPRLSNILDESKVSRAQTEVDNLGAAINQFNSHTTLWPAGAGAAIGGTAYNTMVALVTGTQQVDGAPATIWTNEVLGMLPAAPLDWPTVAAGTVDFFDNHLRLNNPGNGCSSGPPCDNRYYPPQADAADSAGFTSAVNQTRDPWRGPYTETIRFDPWARRYISNIVSAWDNVKTNNLVSVVISAGPDGAIDTDGQVTDAELPDFNVVNDDVAYIVRQRAGQL